MRITELLELLKVDSAQTPQGDCVINGAALYPLQIEAGDLFFALPGDKIQQNIDISIERSAKVIVWQSDEFSKIEEKSGVLFISVTDVRAVIPALAAKFYPNQPGNVVAVTGTNGKSSVVHFVRQLACGIGLKAASLGTLGVQSDASLNLGYIPSLTTFDALTFHRIMHGLHRQDISLVALEASSHGLEQKRVHGVKLKAAAFTNLTQDHLDYHGTMENYFNAKAKLFTEVLPEGGVAVIYGDSPYTQRILEICQQRKQTVLTYSCFNKADIYAADIQYLPTGITFYLKAFGQDLGLCQINLVGLFQLENVLCALGLMVGMGYSLDALLPNLKSLTCVPGRMDYVASHPSGAPIFVDFAHTPDALKSVLNVIKYHCQGKLKLVFGCGGDRDPIKRKIMGEVAQELADVVYITDDNPRTEDPALIREMIFQGCPKGIIIDDRRKAIEQALAELESSDILIIAGKGHENGQIIGNETFPFNDTDEVKQWLGANK